MRRIIRLGLLLAAALLVPACHRKHKPLPSVPASEHPSLRVTAAGNPVVAWEDTASSLPQVFLREWNGTLWTQLANSATGSGVSASAQTARVPSLALDSSSGNPVIAWSDSASGNGEIYLKRWNGSSWLELGGSATAGGLSNLGSGVGGSGQCSLALDSSANPAVAWEVDALPFGTPNVYFKRWSGSAWVELGGSATGTGIASSGLSPQVSLAIEPGGNPVIAWRQSVSGGTPTVQIYLKRWNGSSWVELGGSATSGGLSNSTGMAESPSVALDVGGNPTVAWQDSGPGTLQIYLRQWTGSAWIELAGSASTTGVSGTSGLAERPSLALDSTGKPAVAWSDTKAGNAEIYLKKWNGASWVELGSSATAGGISNTSGSSLTPSLGLDGSGNPVTAWTDDSSGGTEIYIRQWSGTQWVELNGSGSGTGISP